MGTGTEKARSLYQIDEELSSIITAMEEESMFPLEIEAAIDAWLDDNRQEIEGKIDRYCAVIASKTAMAQARKAEAQAIRKMAEQDERTAELLKERCKAFFERIGKTSMETLRFKPHIQANGGERPLHVSENLDDIPTMFVDTRTVSTANKELIRMYLEGGRGVPGCSLGERGSHFRIR